MNRPLVVAAVFASLISVALISMDQTGAAQPAGFEALSIDMEPAGNNANSLGPRQECTEALPGETITIDVTIEGISASTPMLGYAYTLEFPGPTLTVTDYESIKIESNPGSQPFSGHDPLPQFDGTWMGGAIDISPDISAYETGDGVLDRVTIEVATDAAPSIYPLSLTAAALVDQAAQPHSPPVTNNARLAIGVTCAASTPVPPVSGTSTPAPDGTGGPGTTTAPGGTTPPGNGATPDNGTNGPGASPDGDSTGSPSPTGTASRSPTPSGSPGESNGDNGGNGENGDGGDAILIVIVAAIVVAAVVAGGILAYRRFAHR